MNALLEAKFAKMGARAKVVSARLNRGGGTALRIDIRTDNRGEYFEIQRPSDLNIEAIDVRPRDRHLLLITRPKDGKVSEHAEKYLCGHDERHWFVAAVPERQGVRDVATAKDALMPQEVRDLVDRMKVATNARYTRRNRAFVRQGEWFFVPKPDLKANLAVVLRNEPIRRGAGKPHWCQELLRTGGERVYVRFDHPNGLTQKQYSALDVAVRKRARWRVMQRDAQVYVRGSVRHPDHATIYLDGWHRMLMNTETQSRAMRNVAFLD